eukprot:CAMPEP_0196579316 /NCGR_PEP_ID=MMETSP1081-20130531/20025_1 /TAXON_ID=36882 /ORGANISM="Pyramimonas amylifera, Strain CCMP720" /LENGTH=389 /DNA_ID=CAMNT_0041898851 /DNA_START=191 /DNA_END=1360 /DNA_ORIENTATION=+
MDKKLSSGNPSEENENAASQSEERTSPACERGSMIFEGVWMKLVSSPVSSSAPRGRHPKDTDTVSLLIQNMSQPQQKELEWESLREEIGSGRLMEGVEKAVMRMELGQEVVVTLEGEMSLPDSPADIPPDFVPSIQHTLRIQLKEHVAGAGDKVTMTAEDKLIRSQVLKALGAGLYSAGRVRRAQEKWEAGVQLFNILQAEDRSDPHSAEMNRRCQDAQVFLLLNTALCKLKRSLWKPAHDDCTEVLDLQPHNVKALFRRGQAGIQLDQWDEAEKDFKKAQQLDPTLRREISSQMKILTDKKKAQNQKDMPAMQAIFAKGNVYSSKEVAPIRKVNDSPPIQIKSLESEYDEIEEEEEEDALMKRQQWYNQMLGTGQMRLGNTFDDDDDS